MNSARRVRDDFSARQSIALALIVLQHVAAQGVTLNDVERHLWVILLYRLMQEAIKD
jgi:hypothetical protein